MVLNVARFRQIQSIIREEPRRFEMSQWVQTNDQREMVQTMDLFGSPQVWEFPECGTACCLNGDVVPVYSEPKVITFAHPVEWRDGRAYDKTGTVSEAKVAVGRR